MIWPAWLASCQLVHLESSNRFAKIECDCSRLALNLFQVVCTTFQTHFLIFAPHFT